MKNLALTLFIIFIFIPLSSPARSDEDIFELEEVVVTATRTEESVLDVPQHVTVITEEEIRESGSKNLAEVLSVHTGVSISDIGPAGAMQSLSIRGSTSSQVLVLIDGVRAVGSHGGADLSLIPLDNIERIEIVRGGTSALYGADAVGGVINIITKKKADNKLKIFIENGSYLPKKHVKVSSSDEYDPDYLDLLDTQKATIQYSKDIKGIQLITSGTFNRARNGYIFKDTNNKNIKRENAYLIGGNLSAGIYLPLEHGGVDLTGSYLNNKKGIPGAENDPSLKASQSDQNIQSALRYYTDNFFTDRLTFDVNTHFNFSKLIYKDPQSIDSEHKTYSTGLEIVQEMLAFDIFSLVYGGNIGLDVVDSTDLGDIDRIHGGGFIECPLYLTARFTLQPVLRYDYYSDFKGDLNFKLGGVYRISDTASLKGSISKSYRVPNFNDLYWPDIAGFEGNPDLKPETGYSLDFGVSSIRKDIQYDIFGFVRYIKDVILWQPDVDGKWSPTNLGEALYPGIETYLNVSFLNYFKANIGYTFLYTCVLTGDFTLKDNKRLPMIPVHEIDFGLGYEKKKNLFRVNAHYESLRYEKVTNSAYLTSHFVVNVHYRRSVSEHFSFLISVDNLFNEQYDIENKYPMPGMFIRTGIEAVF